MRMDKFNKPYKEMLFCIHYSREATVTWHVGSEICLLLLLWLHYEHLWSREACKYPGIDTLLPPRSPSGAVGQLLSPAELCFKTRLYFPFDNVGTNPALDGSQRSPELFSLTSSCLLTTGTLVMTKDDRGQQ